MPRKKKTEETPIEEAPIVEIKGAVFGIISYLPDKEPDRELRIERLNRTLNRITELWPDYPILIIAQNWKGLKLSVKATIIEKPKLGILGARKVLREEFLKTNYNYLIMCDDDAIIEVEEGAPEAYMNQLKSHPDGFCFLTYIAAHLTLCAISRAIYDKEPMVDIDPQKSEGYEDSIFAHLLHYKYPDKEFKIEGIKCTQFQNPNEKAPSTWAYGYNFNYLSRITSIYIDNFKMGNFNIGAIKEAINKGLYYKQYKVVGGNPKLDERIQYSLERHWINVADIPELVKQWGLK